MVTVGTDLRLTIARLRHDDAATIQAHEDRVALLDEFWSARRPEPQADSKRTVAQQFEDYWYSQAVRAHARAQLAIARRDNDAAILAYQECAAAAAKLQAEHDRWVKAEKYEAFYEQERAPRFANVAAVNIARLMGDEKQLIKELETIVKTSNKLTAQAGKAYAQSVGSMDTVRYHSIRCFDATANADLAQARRDLEGELRWRKKAVVDSARLERQQVSFRMYDDTIGDLVQRRRFRYVAQRALAKLSNDLKLFQSAQREYQERLDQTYSRIKPLYDVQAVGGEAVKLHYIRAAQMQARLNGLSVKGPEPK
jgi:hypothetical protein